MRLPWALVFGALLGVASANDAVQTAFPESDAALVPRQDDSSSVSDAPPAETTSAGGGDDATTSQPPDETTTDAGNSPDTTLYDTITVTDDNAATVSSRTTILATSTSTVVITHTKFSTTTVTSKDLKTATSTIYETSTSWANEKRALNLAPRTLGPAEAAASVTAPIPSSTAAPATRDSYELVKEKRDLAKRETFHSTKTVTVGGGDATTVLSTIRKTVVRTSTTDTTKVNMVTETEAADASTTTTITSTLTVTSTSVTTGEQTQTDTGPAPTDSAGADTGSGSNGGDSGGLSTGAKAGIGAGVGVAALLALGALAFFFFRRRRNSYKPNHDDLMGASEVPVGGPVGGSGHTPPMSQHSSTAAAFLAPGRSPPKQSVSPEGYRGTAAGDGRAGYAKPAPFGSAYAQPNNRSSTLVSDPSTTHTNDYLPEHAHPMPAEMGGGETAAATRQAQTSNNAAELGTGAGANKWHITNAAEMDSSQTTSPVSPHSAAPILNVHPPPQEGQDVHEMPAQHYK